LPFRAKVIVGESKANINTALSTSSRPRPTAEYLLA
jgi:hypothetical protein